MKNDTPARDARLRLEHESDTENVATFLANQAKGIPLSVSEERAMDSDNVTFECTLALSQAQAATLREWLNEWFPGE